LGWFLWVVLGYVRLNSGVIFLVRRPRCVPGETLHPVGKSQGSC